MQANESYWKTEQSATFSKFVTNAHKSFQLTQVLSRKDNSLEAGHSRPLCPPQA